VHRLSVLLTLVVTLCAPSALSAQHSPSSELNDPRVEIFGGYSGYRAGGNVSGVTVPDFTTGWAGQVIVNTTHWVGIVADLNGHYNSFASAHDFAVGVRLQRPLWRFVPFGEGLLGVQHFSPKGLPSQNAPTYIGGAGLDVKVTSRISVRPLQLSYVNSVYNANAASTATDKNNFNGFRAQAGLIYNLGIPWTPGNVKAVCTAEPSEVYIGEAVKVTVAASGFLPKRTLSYSYEVTGGKVAGDLGAASVDTTGVEAGSYTVTAKVVDDGKGKHRQGTGCEAAFKVKAKLPPTLSVTAVPTSLLPGESSTITLSGNNPEDRPLSYTCSASGGQLSGIGRAYTLDTAGTPEGKIEVKCSVSDDRNLSASASANVEVAIPKSEIPPPVKFGTIEFLRDPKRPTRVDNQAKGELDRFADAMAATPSAKAVVLGYGSSVEKADSRSLTFAALRAVNTKDYLKKDKGVDPSRIEVRTGSGDGQKVELWIVPTGSSFTSPGSAVVDENKVKAVPRIPLKPKIHRRGKKHKHKAK